MTEHLTHTKEHENNGNHSPWVRPSQQLWDYCLEVALNHGRKGIEVLKDILFDGELVSKINESEGRLGHVVWIKPDGTQVDFHQIEKNKSE